MQQKKERYLWIDNAKAIGMILVYYGHLVERVYQSGVEAAFWQWRFIYAFHMPLYFFIAGFFYNKNSITLSVISKRFLRRIVPVLFFGIVCLPFWLVHYSLTTGEIPWITVIEQILSYFRGKPMLNWVSWFLVCLFTCEVLAYSFLSQCRTRLQIQLFAWSSLFAGLLICQHLPAITKVFSIQKNLWFIHESIVALGFYALGYSVFPVLKFLSSKKYLIKYGLFVLCLIVTCQSVAMNNPTNNFVVMLITSQHGHILPFLIASLAGTLMVVTLSMLLPYSRVMAFIGKNGLVFLGLNGIFHHFVNQHLATMVSVHDSPLGVIAFCTFVTAVSLLITSPLVLFIHKKLPQLVGIPDTSGPFLPDLEELMNSLIRHWRGTRLAIWHLKK